LIAIQAGVEKKNMAIVTGTRNFVRNLRSTFGLAVTGTIINNSLASKLSNKALGLSATEFKTFLADPSSVQMIEGVNSIVYGAVLEAYHTGFQRTFYALSGLATFGGLMAILLIPQIDLDKKEASDVDAGKRSHDIRS
jgi:hypothetical protein